MGKVMSYEYKVVPAPARGLKAKGVKTSEDRFANALETAMNELAADGWEYLRADTLPCEQREGLMSKKSTVFQNMLVFRRAKAAARPAPRPAVTAPPVKASTPPNPPKAPEVVAPKPAENPDVPPRDSAAK